jgi:hypothetical protein
MGYVQPAGRVTFYMGEDDDESLREDDDESLREDDDESYTRYGEFLPRVRKARSYGKGAQGTKGGVLNVPGGGTAQVQFSKTMVTKADFDKAMEQIRTDHNETRKLIATLDSRITASMKSVTTNMGSNSMLPLLLGSMQPPPQIRTIEFAPGQTISPTTTAPVNVARSTMSSGGLDMMTLLLFMMMSGGGGGLFGSGGDSTNKGGGGGISDILPLFLIMQMQRPT